MVVVVVVVVLVVLVVDVTAVRGDMFFSQQKIIAFIQRELILFSYSTPS